MELVLFQLKVKQTNMTYEYLCRFLLRFGLSWRFFAFAFLSNAIAGTAIAAAPNIQGNVNIEVEVGNVVNYAEATGSVAQVAIASVSEGSIGGFTAAVSVGDVINYASGNGSCSQVLIGSVGVPSCVAGDATATEAPPPPPP